MIDTASVGKACPDNPSIAEDGRLAAPRRVFLNVFAMEKLG